MNTVTLTSDGALAQDNASVGIDPLMFLGHKVELEQGYTLRSFFKMIERYPVFTQLNAFLPECIDQYRGCPAPAANAWHPVWGTWSSSRRSR